MAKKKSDGKADDLFKDRLRREKRYDDFAERCKQLVREEGVVGVVAYRQAREEFGYLGAEGERRALAQFKADSFKQHILDMAHRDRKVQTVSRATDMAEAMIGLPDRASIQDEMNWVLCHPAMTRKHHAGNTKLDLVLFLEDITNPPGGMAPSKAAVIMLQTWMHKPEEFLKMVLAKEWKADTGNGVTEVDGEVEDLTLDRVARMLATIESRRKDGESSDNADAG